MRILSPNPALPATGGIWEGRGSTFSQYLHAHFILPTSFVSFTIAPHYLTPSILGSFDYFDPLLRSSCGERAKEKGEGVKIVISSLLGRTTFCNQKCPKDPPLEQIQKPTQQN